MSEALGAEYDPEDGTSMFDVERPTVTDRHGVRWQTGSDGIERVVPTESEGI